MEEVEGFGEAWSLLNSVASLGAFRRMGRVEGRHAPAFDFSGACADRATQKGRRRSAGRQLQRMRSMERGWGKFLTA